jgi:hypothetical protein
MLRVLTAAGLAGSAALLALAPAAAQDTATNVRTESDGTRIAEIIVFGTDPCPRVTENVDAVVCARRPESERYRIPERLRQGGSVQSRQSWAARARSFEVNTRRGIGSCDAVGPGGQTGCLQKMIDQARAESRAATTEGTAPEE